MTSNLIPQNIVLSSTSVTAGAGLLVSWSLANTGADAADATSRTAVRITQSPTSFAGTDAATPPTPALQSQMGFPQNATLTVPTTPGVYYVWVVANAGATVTNESDTSNDLQHSVAFTVTNDTALDTTATNAVLTVNGT